MSKRINTKSVPETIEVAGFRVYSWTKVCAYCRKEYKTTSRGQKYCSEACCTKAQKKHQRAKKEYNANKEINRLAARSHALGVEVLTQLDRLGIRPKVCEVCGATTDLQVHHVSMDWTNNNPSNLKWLCTKCHSAEHSRIEAELKESGKSFEELYDPYVLPLISQINKNCNG